MSRQVVSRGFKEVTTVNVSKVYQGNKLTKGNEKRLLGSTQAVFTFSVGPQQHIQL